MNERTLELALQAGLKKAHGADREYMGDFDWREFADLIVKEVLTVQSKLIMIDGINGYHLERPTKEHFGIDQ